MDDQYIFADTLEAARQYHDPPGPSRHPRLLLSPLLVAIDVPDLQCAARQDTGMYIYGAVGDFETRCCVGRFP